MARYFALLLAVALSLLSIVAAIGAVNSEQADMRLEERLRNQGIEFDDYPPTALAEGDATAIALAAVAGLFAVGTSRSFRLANGLRRTP
jgi:hypothetical protein